MSELRFIFRSILIALAIGAITAPASFAGVVAVLEIVPSGENANLSISEYRHLTDELRRQARETLPRGGYSILTRDNIIQLIPAEQVECLAESCAIDIGRAIGAEYVTQGFVGGFDGMLTLTVELYESMSGNLLGSFVTESDGVRGLLGTIREQAPRLFGHITRDNARMSQIAPSQPAETSMPVPPPRAKKEKSELSLLTARNAGIGLGALGGLALLGGIYQHSQAKKHYSEYESFPRNLSSSQYSSVRHEYEERYRLAEDSRKKRDLYLALGSALLLSGVYFYVWF